MSQQQTAQNTQPKARPLADLVAPSLETPQTPGLPASVWVKIVVVAGLLTFMNYEQLAALAAKWLHDPNWTHGFLMPLFSLYLLFSRRHELRAVRRESCVWGLPILMATLALQVLCVFPIRNDWFYQLNMVLMMLALALYLGGTRVFRLTWVPIAFLAFAMPIPDRLYTMMAYPLQELAAKSSFLLLKLAGAQIENVASHLDIVGLSGQTYQVDIVEACSGMRSLMAFVALGVAMAYLEERPWWHKVIFVICAVPIAIACNILRVTITCSAYLWDKPEFGEKFMHEVTGMVMLIPAFAMLWVVGKILQSLFVEEEEDDPSPSDSAQSEVAS